MSLLIRPSTDNRQIKVSKSKFVTLDPTKEFEAEETSPLLSLLYSSPSRPNYGALHELARMAQNFNRIQEETKSTICCEFVDDCLKAFALLNNEQTNSLRLLNILRDRSRTLEKLSSMVERGSKSLTELRRLGFIHSNEPICRQYLCEKLGAVAQRWDAMVEHGDRSGLHDEHYRGFNDSVERNIDLASNFALLLSEETHGEWRFEGVDVGFHPINVDSSTTEGVHLDNNVNQTTSMVENVESIAIDQSESIINDKANEIQADYLMKDLSGRGNSSLFDEFTKGLSLHRRRSSSLFVDNNNKNPLFEVSQDVNIGTRARGSFLLASLLKREGKTFETVVQNWKSNSIQTLDDLDDALEKHSIAAQTRNEQALLQLVRPHLIHHMESLRMKFILLQDEVSIDSLSKIGRRVLAFNESLEMVDIESIFVELSHSISRIYSLHDQFVNMHWDWLKRNYESTAQKWNKVREIMIILSRLLEGFSRLEAFLWTQCVQTMNEGMTIARVLQGSNGYISTMLTFLVNDETRSLARICQASELLLELNVNSWNENFERLETCVRFFHSRVVQDSTLQHFFYF